MLIGPGTRPILPVLPREDEGLRGIIHYLRQLDTALRVFNSQVVVNSVGMVGTRGLSATGTVAQNFRESLAIGGRGSATWTFTGFEADTSYMVLAMSSVPASTFLTGVTMTLSGVDFTFAPTNASGIRYDVMLLR